MNNKSHGTTSQSTAQYEISGAGVLHVRASEILKTAKAQKQIRAAQSIKLKNINKYC